MPAQYRRRRPPARVFWVRRAVVLGIPALLILLLFNALTSSPAARPAGRATLTASSSSAPARPGVVAGPAAVAAPSAASGAPLASPDGPCAPSEVIATPTVPQPASAGGPVTIAVQLTATRPACTFDISGANLAVKIGTASGDIWRSQDCPASVAAASVVVRSGAPTPVTVTWDGHASQGSCGAANPWVGAGSYVVTAAVIGSAPTQAQFALSLPPAPVVTQTASPVPVPVPAPAPAPSASPDAKH